MRERREKKKEKVDFCQEYRSVWAASHHHQAHVGVMEGEKTRPVWQERKLETSICRFSLRCDEQSTREHVLLGSVISYVTPGSPPLLIGPHRSSFFFRVVSWFYKSRLKVTFQCLV